MRTSPKRERWLARAIVICTFALALGHAAASAGEAPRAANPFASSQLPAEERFTLTGEVVSHLDAGSYAYFEVRDAHGARHWVVTLAATAPDDARFVDATILGRASDFHSTRLGRRFETLLFGIVLGAGGETRTRGDSNAP